MVALQALTVFAQRIYGTGLDVTLTAVGDQGTSKNFHVTHDNSIIVQRHDLDKPTSVLRVKAEGKGCVLLQVRWNRLCTKVFFKMVKVCH